MFRFTLIPRPKWARQPDVWLHDMKLADYNAVQERRSTMLAVVHEEIENYLNTPGLYYDGDEEGFPNRCRMTGDYYIGNERYMGNVGPVLYQISIMARCLGKRLGKSRRPDDYLGLEVWLSWDPKNRSFTIFRNTDSSVI